MSHAVYGSVSARAPQPLVDRSCVDHWRSGIEPLDGRTIKRRAALVIPANPITPDERMGPQIVALMVVRDGAECQYSLSLELPVAL